MNAEDAEAARDATRRSVAMLGAVALLVVATIWAFSEDRSQVRFTGGVRIDPRAVYNPVTAGEPLPAGFRQILPRDAIMPVYNPTFVPARDVGWPDDTDVIGVERNGQAKAYPVSFLNGRELVDDVIDDIPIVVTW